MSEGSIARTVSLQPVIKLFATTLDFVTHLVNGHGAPSIIIVCGTRDLFLQPLLRELRSLTAGNEGPSERPPHPEHMLLAPTLHLLAQSQTLRIAYMSTLPHLRAYLATFSARSIPDEPQRAVDKASSLRPAMALLNPLALHRSTGDLTAQGLNRTISLAVEAACREGMQLNITELGHERGNGDEPEPSVGGVEELSDPWEEKVPLLNSSLRFRGEERAWAGKTVKISHIASRWCQVLDCRP